MSKYAEKEAREITFRNLRIAPTKITIDVEYSAGTFPLWYEFNRAIPVSSSAVALALSTLCGEKFSRISFDFEVDQKSKEAIENFSKAEVNCFHTRERLLTEPRSGSVLSFSGGFDSLAAIDLMPHEAHLVSIDFGGWFEREAKFFRRFEPLVVTTNIRRTPDQRSALARNHWTFMATGAILTSQYFNAAYHSFGSILGESFASRTVRPKRVLPLEAAGYVDAPYTNGISEVGTAKIILQSRPEMIRASIDSLAGKNDRKRYLKIALTKLMSEELGIAAEIPSLPAEWNSQIPFNSSYTTALSALYFIARGRAEWISPLFREIPGSALKLASDLEMRFLEKVNLDHNVHLPNELWSDFSQKLESLRFRPYSEQDWDEVKTVRAYLATIF